MRHGQQLLAIFPKAVERDPGCLCRMLRRRENQLANLALAYCNGEIDTDEIDREGGKILAKVQLMLGSNRPWFNRDPRGYALKVDLRDGETLHRDMGGYGIIAPDLSERD